MLRLAYIAVFAFIAASQGSHGQRLGFTVVGTLKDISTQQALPFASLGVKGKPFSAITNTFGEFEFHIKDAAPDDTVVFSMIGYHNLCMSVNHFSENTPNTFFLLPKKEYLNELVFSDSLSARDILQIAVRRIQSNYPSMPFLMNGFYREVAMENGQYTSLLEAAVNISDKNYQQPKKTYHLKEKIGLVEIRKSYNYQKYRDKKDKGTNFLSMLLQDNLVRYPNHRGCFGAFAPVLLLPDYIKFKREADTFFDNERVFVIKAYHCNPRKGYDPHYYKIFVNATDYGFYRIDLMGKAKDNIIHEDPYQQKVSLQMLYVNNTLRFKKFQGKYFLNYIKANWGFQAVDRNSHEVLDVFEYKKELLVNNIQEEKAKRSKLGRRMKRLEKLDRQAGRYNADFWSQYNIIKLNPLESSIVNDLERKVSLNRQFSSSKGGL